MKINNHRAIRSSTHSAIDAYYALWHVSFANVPFQYSSRTCPYAHACAWLFNRAAGRWIINCRPFICYRPRIQTQIRIIAIVAPSILHLVASSILTDLLAEMEHRIRMHRIILRFVSFFDAQNNVKRDACLLEILSYRSSINISIPNAKVSQEIVTERYVVFLDSLPRGKKKLGSRKRNFLFVFIVPFLILSTINEINRCHDRIARRNSIKRSQ